MKSYLGVAIRQRLCFNNLGKLTIKQGTNKTLIGLPNDVGSKKVEENDILNIKTSLFKLGVKEEDILGIYSFIA